MEMDMIRIYDTFITLKIEFETSIDLHTNLAMKYKALLSTLQLTDEDLIIRNKRD